MKFTPDVQAYLVVLFFGVSAPMVIFWMLYLPLCQFLAEIFRSKKVEQFWVRLIVVVLVSTGVSQAVGYQPAAAVSTNFVALVWNLAEQIRSVLEALLWSMLATFLPLLLAYTILHAGRFNTIPSEKGGE
jgi:hypothetical protein